MRTFWLALGLATILLGLFLLFAGYVGVGCSVGGSSANPTLSNCGAASELEVAGAILTVVAVLMFVGAFVPEREVGSQ
jgi:uncharacterized membrane protein YadS